MSGIRDLINLKMQQQLLKEQLAANQSKYSKVEKVLANKSIQKNASLPPPTNNNNNICNTTMVSKGKSLADFRMNMSTNTSATAMHAIRSVPKVTSTFKLEAKPITHSNEIYQKRIEYAQKTQGKKEVEKRLENIKRAPKKKDAQVSKSRIPVPASLFPNRYKRGELPCSIEHGGAGQYLSWVCPLENLDYEYYLPMFFDGLQLKEQPLAFLARQGVEDLLQAAHNAPDRILPYVSLLVRPIRNALSRFDADILMAVLTAIQQLIHSAPGVGEALMPFCKQFLAPMNSFLDCNNNIGDAIDYGQRKNNDVGAQVLRTLEEMERFGGPYAFRAIKTSIPTCYNNSLLSDYLSDDNGYWEYLASQYLIRRRNDNMHFFKN